MGQENEKNERRQALLHKALSVFGIVLCVLLFPVLIVNCTMIVKSWINEDEVPTFGGHAPLIVLSDSMVPQIKTGDIIICKVISAEEVEVGDVISFYDPASKGTSVVTHKVKSINEEDGKLTFTTYGINNFNADGTNKVDDKAVPAKNLIGEYTGVRIPIVGHVALFMQTTGGLIVCVLLPLLLLIGFDILKRRKQEKASSEDVAALMAELEALKAANAAKEKENGSKESLAEKENAER